MKNVKFDREELEDSAIRLYNHMRDDEAKPYCRGSMDYSTHVTRSIQIYRNKDNPDRFSVDAETATRQNAFCYWTKCCDLMILHCDVSIKDKFPTAEDFAAYVTKYITYNYSELSAT